MADTDTAPHPITAARNRARLSMEALAYQAGVSVATVYRAEAGRHITRVDTREKLAAALGVTAESLVPERAHDPNLPGSAGGAPHGTSEKTTDRDATPAPRSDSNGA